MGLGILLKAVAPLSLYGSGVLCALMALIGNVRWALLLAVFLIPLRNIIDRIQHLPLGNQFIDILVISILFGWMINASAKGRRLFQKSSINAIAVVVIIYTLISTLLGGIYLHGDFSINLHDPRMKDWKNFSLLPILFYITLNNTLEKKDIWLIIGVMCLSMFVVDFYTINQIRWYSSLESRSKITGTFQFLGPNEVAAFFNEYTIILMTLFYSIKKKWQKLLLLGLILINVFCITFTYSRGAYAGFLVGLMILFYFKDKKMLIPIILVLCLWQTALPEKVVERIKETKTDTGQLDESSQRRINIWHQALELFQSNPVTGIGFGVFRYLGLDLGDTHNIYVKLLTEQGLIGFSLFLVVVFCFVREGLKLYQKGETEEEKGLGLGFLICLSVMMVNNFFGDRWSYMEPNAYLWIFAGLVSRLNVMALSPKPVVQYVQKVEAAPVEPLYEKIKKRIETSPVPGRMRKRVRYYDL